MRPVPLIPITGEPSSQPSYLPTSSPTKMFNFGGLMVETHPLGIVFILTIIFYFYRGIREESIRQDILKYTESIKMNETKLLKEIENKIKNKNKNKNEIEMTNNN